MSPDREKKKSMKVAIRTFGCQMNMYDTEVAEGFLADSGYEIVSEADEDLGQRPFRPKADVILMNTCSVREHAEDRVYGRLGMLSKAKRDYPELIVGLMGCMTEEHRESLFRRFPALDLMVGTRNIRDLPALIDEVRNKREQVSRLKREGISIEYTDLIRRRGRWHAWLPIMTGCNKVCTFCIVPVTRGSEVSMASRDVFREASRLVEEGVKWITLLGQNVNSYSGGSGATGSAFPELLEMLCSVEGLECISFTTSHPQDATPELFRVIARNPVISRRFHLPLQSGSDRVLRRMKRLHTYPDFLEKIRQLRLAVPDISITTDIIAGFCGESPEDHALTAAALREIRFDGAFIYKYSTRPGTPAAKLRDDVSQAEKESRNGELLTIQKDISSENARLLLGTTTEVFVEAASVKDAGERCGRSRQERKVIFRGGPDRDGSWVRVRLDSLHNETFRAQALDS